MEDCRTCLGQVTGKNSVNVDALVIDEINVLQAIKEVSSLEIETNTSRKMSPFKYYEVHDDFLPKHICKKCFKLLKSTTLFRRTIIYSYTQFRSKFNNHSEIKNQDSNADISGRATNIKFEEVLLTSSEELKAEPEFTLGKGIQDNHKDPDNGLIDKVGNKQYEEYNAVMHEDQMNITENDKTVKNSQLFPGLSKLPPTRRKREINRNYNISEVKTELVTKSKQDEEEFDPENIKHDKMERSIVTKQYNNKNGSKCKAKMLTSHTCALCGVLIKGQKKYKMHMHAHISDDPPLEFECSICPKRYLKKEYLLVHTRSHTGEKPFHCDICNKNFSQFATYYVHKRRLHDKVVQGTCNYCGKMFVDKPELDVHIKMWHTGERPYLCEFCSATFVCNRTLQRHRKEIHSEKKPCQKCGKMLGDYALKKHLVRHQVMEEGLKIVRKKYTCEYCKTVMNFTSRRRHLEKQHGIKLHGRGDSCTKIPIKEIGVKTNTGG